MSATDDSLSLEIEHSSPDNGITSCVVERRGEAERARVGSSSGGARARSSSSVSFTIARSGSSASNVSYSGGKRASTISDFEAAAAPIQEEIEVIDSEGAGGNRKFPRKHMGKPCSSGDDLPMSQIPERPLMSQPSPKGLHSTSLSSPSQQLLLDERTNCQQAKLADDIDEPKVDSEEVERYASILSRPVEAFVKNTEAHQEKGNGSFSLPVLFFKSSLDYADLMQFLFEATSCNFEAVPISNIHLILSGKPMVINKPCFTELYDKGRYRLRLQIGVGIENISVGIALMKGKNDNDKSLPWPFNMIVMFRLKNLNGGKYRVKMFRCDKNGSKIKEAISKPKGEMNPAVGFPCFISKQCLLNEGFVEDNQILLQCFLFPRDAKITLHAEVPSIIK